MLAVAAHRWLNMASVIRSGAETLLSHHEDLPAVARDELLAIMVAKANQLEDSLIESFSAARPALRAALQQLQPSLD
jgi:predicted nucleic acid-binding OB-fold protein